MFSAWMAMIRRWFGRSAALPDRAGGAQGGDEAPSALALMQQMRAERAGPADEREWQQGVATLEGRVFSGVDRARLWKRARRRHPGEVLDLELITAPTTHDLAALQDLLRELERA